MRASSDAYTLTRRRAFQLGSAFVLAGFLGRPAYPQSKYPERPIKLVIPFAPGGITDTVGRQWADKMKASLGHVYIENQAGAGGLVGGAAVARANPDGYTILLGTVATHLLVPSASAAAPYNPATDLVAISIVVTSSLAIAIHPGLPIRTLQELIDYAKANPGKLSCGSTGAGSMSHLAGELFKSLAGTPDIVTAPYKGAGPALSDVISGHIAMTVSNVTGHMLDLHRSGKVRMLAVTAPARLSAAPDIPTAIESGLPGMVAQSFAGLFAPAGTPNTIVERISHETHVAMTDPELRQKLIASGFEPYADSSPAAARRFVEEEIGRLTPVIKALGAKLG
jgi:tripartite-type tricarboxylate transporter receptor subunit TctC